MQSGGGTSQFVGMERYGKSISGWIAADGTVPGKYSGRTSFGTLDRCWRPLEERDHALSRWMLDFRAEFIKTGTPKGTGEWSAYIKERPYIIEFE